MPRVIITVKGGLVTAVYSDEAIDVDVVDYDSYYDADPDEDYNAFVQPAIDELENNKALACVW